ncbi:MAG: ATP-grasp domain-containing protein [Candidatus Dadabacteria bacterium]|nr:ATP-grasp domain-containing protein [Candidatus Dadabacteria bacterium]
MRVLVASTCLPYDRLTLCVLRSLAQNGASVTVGANQLLSRPFFSRYIKEKVKYPHPIEDMIGFVQSLSQHIADKKYDVLIPIYDYITSAVALNKDELTPYVKIPIPDYEVIQKALDKLHILELAKDIGIETPLTFCVKDRKDLETIAGSIEYPCVLKLRRGFGAFYINYPESFDELIRCYEWLPSRTDLVLDFSNPLIQEYVPGEIHDVCLLFNHGEVRAGLTQKRLKMYPSRGGIGIYNETTYEPELRDQAVALLEKLKWHGPAMVEFKIDSRDGSAKLMEVNGRLWGGLDISIQAGMNFPLLACKIEVEGDVKPVFDYKVGLRHRWLFPTSLFYTRGAGGGLRSLWEFFRYEPGTKSDLLLSDPLPFLSDFYFFFRRFFKSYLNL